MPIERPEAQSKNDQETSQLCSKKEGQLHHDMVSKNYVCCPWKGSLSLQPHFSQVDTTASQAIIDCSVLSSTGSLANGMEVYVIHYAKISLRNTCFMGLQKLCLRQQQPAPLILSGLTKQAGHHCFISAYTCMNGVFKSPAASIFLMVDHLKLLSGMHRFRAPGSNMPAPSEGLPLIARSRSTTNGALNISCLQLPESSAWQVILRLPYGFAIRKCCWNEASLLQLGQC